MPVANQHQLQIAQCPFCHDKMIIKVQTCLSFPYKCQSYQSWKINSKSHMKAVSSSLTLGRKAFENVWLCKISTSLTATTGHIQEVIKSIICCVIRHQCQSLQVLPGTIYQCYCQVKSDQNNLENNLFPRYNDDYDQAGRKAKMEDARITPGFMWILKFYSSFQFLSKVVTPTCLWELEHQVLKEILIQATNNSDFQSITQNMIQVFS